MAHEPAREAEEFSIGSFVTGIGGIFYDYLDSGDWEADFAFTQRVGRAFRRIYPELVARNFATPWGEPELDQLVDVCDRLVVDSSEWRGLPAGYGRLTELFDRIAVSDIAWGRAREWRGRLAELWPEIGEIERLATEWDLHPGDRIRVGRELGELTIAGISNAPDNVAFPLATTARVYVSDATIRERLGFTPDDANVALLWLRDPSKADVTLTQARAAAFLEAVRQLTPLP